MLAVTPPCGEAVCGADVGPAVVDGRIDFQTWLPIYGAQHYASITGKPPMLVGCKNNRYGAVLLIALRTAKHSAVGASGHRCARAGLPRHHSARKDETGPPQYPAPGKAHPGSRAEPAADVHQVVGNAHHRTRRLSLCYGVTSRYSSAIFRPSL